jgi:hypothetical protein
MSKHTPGPWRFYSQLVWSEAVKTDQYRTNEICKINERLRVPEDEREANARLIAAAPELLAFANHVLEQIKSGACGYTDGSEAELRNYAEQLIAKAKGGL